MCEREFYREARAELAEARAIHPTQPKPGASDANHTGAQNNSAMLQTANRQTPRSEDARGFAATGMHRQRLAARDKRAAASGRSARQGRARRRARCSVQNGLHTRRRRAIRHCDEDCGTAEQGRTQAAKARRRPFTALPPVRRTLFHPTTRRLHAHLSAGDADGRTQCHGNGGDTVATLRRVAARVRDTGLPGSRHM